MAGEVTTDEALAALERTLNGDLLWWSDDAHGHTQSFRIGMEHGLNQALARVVYLRWQLSPDGQRVSELEQKGNDDGQR